MDGGVARHNPYKHRPLIGKMWEKRKRRLRASECVREGETSADCERCACAAGAVCDTNTKFYVLPKEAGEG